VRISLNGESRCARRFLQNIIEQMNELRGNRDGHLLGIAADETLDEGVRIWPWVRRAWPLVSESRKLYVCPTMSFSTSLWRQAPGLIECKRRLQNASGETPHVKNRALYIRTSPATRFLTGLILLDSSQAV
jgi:hypothetical protein